MSTLGALASGFISLSKFPSSASNIEQIWVELNGIDSRSLPPVLKMDARIVGVKLRKSSTEKSAENLGPTS